MHALAHLHVHVSVFVLFGKKLAVCDDLIWDLGDVAADVLMVGEWSVESKVLDVEGHELGTLG